MGLGSTFLEHTSCLIVGHAPLLQDKSALFYNGHVFVPSIFVKVLSEGPCLNSQLCSDVLSPSLWTVSRARTRAFVIHWCPEL